MLTNDHKAKNALRSKSNVCNTEKNINLLFYGLQDSKLKAFKRAVIILTHLGLPTKD